MIDIDHISLEWGQQSTKRQRDFLNREKKGPEFSFHRIYDGLWWFCFHVIFFFVYACGRGYRSELFCLFVCLFVWSFNIKVMPKILAKKVFFFAPLAQYAP